MQTALFVLVWLIIGAIITRVALKMEFAPPIPIDETTIRSLIILWPLLFLIVISYGSATALYYSKNLIGLLFKPFYFIAGYKPYRRTSDE